MAKEQYGFNKSRENPRGQSQCKRQNVSTDKVGVAKQSRKKNDDDTEQ